MRDLSKYEEQFISMIGVSEETAVRCRDLPIPPREVRFVTASLRQKGVPVVTSDAGYWVAGNQDDIDKTVAVLRAKGRQTLKAAAFLKACKPRCGQ